MAATRGIGRAPNVQGILSRAFGKALSRYALAVAAGVTAAVGCGTDGGTGVAADYALSLTPAALTIVQGANGTATVTITRTSFTDAVTLSLSGAPAEVTGSFNPAAPTGTTSTLTVSVGAAVAAGVYNLTVNGTGSPGNRSTPLTITVSAAPAEYALSLAPAALRMIEGGTGFETVTITRTNFTGAVTLSLGNAPAGVTGSFAPAGPTGTSSTLTVSVAAAVTPGVYNLTVDGTATAGNRSTPLTLTVNSSGGGSSFLAIALAAGSAHTCGLTSAGPAYCWGDDNYGQLGNGATPVNEGISTPVPVAGGLTFSALAAGSAHTCGVTGTGAAYCWGWDGFGQLGTGSTGGGPTPEAVSGSLTFSALATGQYYTCGRTSSGAAFCWGNNENGQLGDGSRTSYGFPVAVSGGLTFSALAAGAVHTCGVTGAGAAYCWGSNFFGELGTGSTTDSPIPVLVSGALQFSALAAGDSHTCGLTSSGAAYCWGSNASGQLGNGSITSSSTPVAVSGGLSFTAIATADRHSCGRTTSGAAYCWGDNSYGQLGDGTTTQRLVPTAVASP